jgi:hypothetical protein
MLLSGNSQQEDLSANIFEHPLAVCQVEPIRGSAELQRGYTVLYLWS